MATSRVSFQIYKPSKQKAKHFGHSDRTPCRTASESQVTVLDDNIIPSPVIEDVDKFVPGPRAFQEQLAPKPVVAVINLFHDGFSMDSQETLFSWTSVVGEPRYEEGTVIVEVRDYRDNRDTEPTSCEGKPNIFRMPLRSTQYTMCADLESKGLDDEDVLKAEEKILKKLHSLCIDPSTDVFFKNNNNNYNKTKYFQNFSNGQAAVKNRLVAKRKRLDPRPTNLEQQRRKRPRLGVVPFLQRIGQKPGVVALLEAEFHKQQLDVVSELEKKIEKTDKGAQREPGKQIVEKVSRRPIPDLHIPAAHQTPLQKRMIRFRMNKGQDFVLFELIPKPNGCYDGRLRVGTSPDASATGEFSERFSIGNHKGAQAFLKSIRDLEIQEWNVTEHTPGPAGVLGAPQNPMNPTVQGNVPGNVPGTAPGTAPMRRPSGPGVPGNPVPGHPHHPQQNTQPGMGLAPGSTVAPGMMPGQDDHDMHGMHGGQRNVQQMQTQPLLQNNRMYPAQLLSGPIRNASLAQQAQLTQRLAQPAQQPGQQPYPAHAPAPPHVPNPVPDQQPAPPVVTKPINTRSRVQQAQQHSPEPTPTQENHEDHEMQSVDDADDGAHMEEEPSETDRKPRSSRAKTRGARTRASSEMSPPSSPVTSPDRASRAGKGRRGRPKKTLN